MGIRNRPTKLGYEDKGCFAARSKTTSEAQWDSRSKATTVGGVGYADRREPVGFDSVTPSYALFLSVA